MAFEVHATGALRSTSDVPWLTARGDDGIFRQNARTSKPSLVDVWWMRDKKEILGTPTSHTLSHQLFHLSRRDVAAPDAREEGAHWGMCGKIRDIWPVWCVRVVAWVEAPEL